MDLRTSFNSIELFGGYLTMNKEMHTSEMLWKDALLVLDSSLLVLLKQLNKEFAIDIIDFLMFKKMIFGFPKGK